MKKHERDHYARLVEIGCIACRVAGLGHTVPNIHHLRNGQGLATKASYLDTIGLCKIHHQIGDGKKASGFQWGFHHSPEKFEATYGTERELLGMVQDLLDKGGIPV